MELIIGGYQWAGCAHWKKSSRVRSKPKRLESSVQEEPTKKRDQKRKKRKEVTKDPQTKVLIDLNTCTKCLEHLLIDKKKSRGKKTVKFDSSQFTAAMINKYSKERNILPQDAEIGVKQFSTLFMRPDTTISELNSGSQISRKSVGKRSRLGFTLFLSVSFTLTHTLTKKKNNCTGFLGTDTMEYDDGVDDSYDSSPGFELANNEEDGGNFSEKDDFVVQELEDVRKVDKVRVKHATVAKKVDVKRLKKELWSELETRTAPSTTPRNENQIENVTDEYDDDPTKQTTIESSETSFKSVVNDLRVNEAQEDVSLAFYFICVLHLANEKCLKLENGEHGLKDFVIARDNEDDNIPV